METILNNKGLEFIKEVIEIGLEKAATALSMLLGEKVLSSPEFLFEQKVTKDYFKERFQHEKAYYLVITKVEGELGAESFLIFDNENAKNLWDKILPDKDREDRSMREAALLEIDNILTATVVTEFANHLAIKAYGDIPTLEQVFNEQVYDLIQNKLEMYPTSYLLKTEFGSENTHIETEFIWFFYPEFIKIIKDKVKKDTV